MTSPTYRVLVDWDSDGGLRVGDFEQGTEDWTSAASGTTAPAVAPSTVRAYHGVGSLLVTWSAGGIIQLVQATPMSTFVAGRDYVMSAWLWVPSSGGMGALCAVAGLALGVASTATDQWTQVTLMFTATGPTHTLQLWSATVPTGGEQTWIDHVQVLGPGEDVTARTPGVIGDLAVQYGRDQARSLMPTSPGEAKFTVDNVDRDLSPENTTSPLFGLLGPGRDVVIEATYDDRVHTLYAGSVDDYDVHSSPASRTASFGAIDAVARLKDQPVSTALFPAVRIGEAIGHVLDAVGWAGPRDLDPGGSSIRWWCVEADDASSVIGDLLVTEGPDAFVSVGGAGEFVFRDRHHRLLRPASTTSQVTFVDGAAVGSEVEHDPPFSINFGWRDVINRVELTATDRGPNNVTEVVWTDTGSFVLAGGQSRQVTVSMDAAVWDLQDPTQGSPTSETDPDIVLLGGPVIVAFSRRSGRSAILTITATASATVTQLRLRGYKVVEVSNAQKIVREDTASIATTRGARPYRPPSPWHNVHDGPAIADLILGKRAERLPVVSWTVTNGSPEQLTQQLARDLSDRVHVVDDESGFDDEVFIERIEHSITDDGLTHTTRFVGEKIRTLPGNVFRFDDATRGFNDGLFAPTGIDDPDTVFIFDRVGQGFDDGLLAL